MSNQWTDSGEKRRRNCQNTIFPLDFHVVPLSHDVGKFVCVVSVKTETQKVK